MVLKLTKEQVFSTAARTIAGTSSATRTIVDDVVVNVGSVSFVVMVFVLLLGLVGIIVVSVTKDVPMVFRVNMGLVVTLDLCCNGLYL